MTLSVLKNDYVLNGTEQLETIRHDQLDALCSYRFVCLKSHFALVLSI